MMTHEDRDFGGRSDIANKFLQELQGRADVIKEQERSKITSGFEGEPVLEKWESNGFQVVHRPHDPQGIIRIAIGGGDDLPVKLNYLVFRGDRGKCVDFLRRALKALETDPE